MQTVTRSELIELARDRGQGPYVSVFLPTHRAGPEVRQDPIRLKNLLTSAQRELEPTHPGLLEPAWALVEDRGFWQHQSDGLALLASPSGLRTYRVPRRFAERVEVGDRFRIGPLIPLLGRDARFHLLALSRGDVRLFECTANGVRTLSAPVLPSSLEEALGRDWEERSLQHATVTPSGDAGRNDAVFHGQGSPRDDDHPETLRFLEMVDRGVSQLVTGEVVPLVLATVDELAGEFAKLTRHPMLLEEHLRGNPDQLSADELREAAWPLVRKTLERSRQEAAERFRERHGTGLATTQVDRVVLAALEGRVDTLFVVRDARCPGRVVSERRSVEIDEEGDEDLLDLAAVEALAHDGEVFVVDHEAMPAEGASAAAVLRYGDLGVH